MLRLNFNEAEMDVDLNATTTALPSLSALPLRPKIATTSDLAGAFEHMHISHTTPARILLACPPSAHSIFDRQKQYRISKSSTSKAKKPLRSCLKNGNKRRGPSCLPVTLPPVDSEFRRALAKYIDQEPRFAVLVCFDAIKDGVMDQIFNVLPDASTKSIFSWQYNIDRPRAAKRIETCRLYNTKQFCRMEVGSQSRLTKILEESKAKNGEGDDEYRIVQYWPGWVQTGNEESCVAGQEKSKRQVRFEGETVVVMAGDAVHEPSKEENMDLDMY